MNDIIKELREKVYGPRITTRSGFFLNTDFIHIEGVESDTTEVRIDDLYEGKAHLAISQEGEDSHEFSIGVDLDPEQCRELASALIHAATFAETQD